MSINEADLRQAIDALFDQYDKDKSGLLEATEISALINNSLKNLMASQTVTL